MTEDKKAKLEKCAVLKANGGRCYVDCEDILECGNKDGQECLCLYICADFSERGQSLTNPSPELIAARLAAVAEYEAKCAEPEKPLLLKDDTEKLEAMKNGEVYVDDDDFEIGFDEDYYFKKPDGEKEEWIGVGDNPTWWWTLKTPAQPHKLTTPTFDQLLGWVCSADALGWVACPSYEDKIFQTQLLPYIDSDDFQFSTCSPTGEYIWHRPMWDSVAGKIVMVPVEG